MIARSLAKKWREENSMTQRTVADMLEVSYLTYSKFERGVTKSMQRFPMRRLEYLVSHGGTEKKTGEENKAHEQSTILCALGRKLHAIADIMQCDNLDIDLRIAELVGFVNACQEEAIEAYRSCAKSEKQKRDASFGIDTFNLSLGSQEEAMRFYRQIMKNAQPSLKIDSGTLRIDVSDQNQKPSDT